jgi:hypothetical protein
VNISIYIGIKIFFLFRASADIVLYIAIKAEDKELIPDSFTLVPFTIAVLEIAADA